MSLSLQEAIEMLVVEEFGGKEVYVRSTTDARAAAAFDLWHKSSEWAQPSGTSTRNVPWGRSKKAEQWELFKEAASKNGEPFVICIVCNACMVHPYIHGTKSQKKHIDSVKHDKMLKQMTKGGSIAEMLAKQGLRGVKVS